MELKDDITEKIKVIVVKEVVGIVVYANKIHNVIETSNVGIEQENHVDVLSFLD